MLPVSFEGVNHTFVKPDSMSDDECGDLRVYRGIDQNGYPMILSAWQPSKEDLEALNAGRPVFLNILGQGMPPVSLFTLNEKGEANV